MDKKGESLLTNGFPFEMLSIIAEQESWRKEINRPTSYIHKWWARRLGSIFRGLIIGGIENKTTNLFDRYYADTVYPNTVIFDPFMGSGTTVTEAVKLGAKVAGIDINPVAVALVQTALTNYNREEIENTYRQLEDRCSDRIKKYYKTSFNGEEVDVLYYFWVKTIICDECGSVVPLYKSSIFSKNAYPSKKPKAQSVCPFCGNINEVKYNDSDAICCSCNKRYNPQMGNISGHEYVCPRCGKHEKIVDYVRRFGKILPEQMFAKMIIDSSGNKRYLSVNKDDFALFAEAEAELEMYADFIPDDCIHEGINTNQILNYQYSKWSEMFNARQLLSFCILSKEIAVIKNPELRQLFAVLMSGTLEFNNMFCSFKGEGTGAVRPLFYNHILKNEFMPLETNVWGCKASSGSFSTLFETRVKRLMDYKEKPFELRLNDKKSEKVFLNNSCILANPTQRIENWSNQSPLIMCGDSAHTNLPDGCVDMVVTDPPFFDNVNYSELADFFYVWLKRMNVGIGNPETDSTRQTGEVQDNNAEEFSLKLRNVFLECYRVLKQDGQLIFTYHHSRPDGWISVFNAICGAGYYIDEVLPLKAEMSVSVAIMSAKEPINYDLVFVCKKQRQIVPMSNKSNIKSDYQEFLKRIESSKLNFSNGDKMVLLYGLILKHLSENRRTSICSEDIEQAIRQIND